ncbi:actin, putative [Entamoeba dispar SAW760]|uniref:Actin, putative n=1 Tax=Entamoeba dispar (strain ATCC PRA-260 / SAW760) TaxID=370354 RepID=B0ESY8_ENTDS|nr:actin, putative [Entamoeba dispar SAW760]EDR22351.1 actin, putative [Entamoeba dispar SAW760]|eukprot:EDR22351.1 actin, putative [Entamoeba dispar SAW760]
MTIILDVGTKEIKAGLSTEELPSIRMSPFCYKRENKYINTSFLNSKQCMKDYEPCILNGELNKEAFISTLEEVFKIYSSDSVIWVKSNDHPRIMGNESYELLFEHFGINKIYSSPSPVLVALSYGQTNGLVLECGNISCWCSVVFSGYVLENSITQLNCAGNFLSQQILNRIERESIGVIPSPPEHSSPSYINLARDLFIDQLKETPNTFNQFDINSYCRELLFPLTIDENNIGVDNTVLKSLMKCDYDVIMEVSNRLILAGGTSLVPNLGENVTDTMHSYFPSFSCEVIKGQTPTLQRYAAWRGGAMIANTRSIQNIWVTKKDYEENGIGIVDRKCG